MKKKRMPTLIVVICAYVKIVVIQLVTNALYAEQLVFLKKLLYNYINMSSSNLNLLSDNNFSKLFSYYSRGQLSWVLVPIAFFIIYNKKYIKYFSYAFITIAIIGTIDIYLAYKYHFNSTTSTILIVILGLAMVLHLILLYPLINIKKYMQPNITQYIFCVFGVLTSYLWPYWPYLISRTNVALTTVLIYLASTLLYFSFLYLNF
jgi:hypothetical protein